MKIWYVVEATYLRVKIDPSDPDLSEISRRAREDYIPFVYWVP